MWKHCTERMRAKVIGHEDYDDIKRTWDCLELLKLIRLMTYGFDTRRYPVMSLAEAEARLFKFYQGIDMHTPIYYQKFKQLVAVIEQFGGNIGNHNMLIESELATITGMDYNDDYYYNPQQIRDAKDYAKDKYLACLFLLGAYKETFIKAINRLHDNYLTRNKNCYPKTLAEAYAFLDLVKEGKNDRTYFNVAAFFLNHGEQQREFIVPDGGQSQGGENDGSGLENDTYTFAQPAAGSNIECWGCKKKGVYLSSCTNPECKKKWVRKQANHSKKAQAQAQLGQVRSAPLKESTNLLDLVDDISGASRQVGLIDDFLPFTMLNSCTNLSNVNPNCDKKSNLYKEKRELNPTRKINKNYLLFDNESTQHMFYNGDYLTIWKSWESNISAKPKLCMDALP